MDPLARIKQWFLASRADLDLGRQVQVTPSAAGTTVRIDHRIPKDKDAAAGWHITTRTQFLPKARFDVTARSAINAASAERGRRLYCIDIASLEVLAAMSYHVDQRRHFPVLLTAIALRTDADALPDLHDRSRAAALLLKQYVHEIAAQLGRGSHVDIDADGVDTLRDLATLGFKRAPRVRGMRPSGRHLRQLPLA